MRRPLVIFGLLLALPACMTEPRGQQAERTAATGPRCLSIQNIVARRVVDDHTIAFDVAGGSYQAEVPEACAALARGPGLTLIELELHGGEVCSGDFFRVVDAGEARTVGFSAFPRCRIGRFSRVPSAPLASPLR